MSDDVATREPEPTAAASTAVVAEIAERRLARAGGCASPSSRRWCWAIVFVVLYTITAWQDDSLLRVAGVRSILLLAAPLAVFAAARRCAC